MQPFFFFFSSTRRKNQRSIPPLPNHPPGDGLIDFGLKSFVKVFLYRSQAFALWVSDNYLLASREGCRLHHQDILLAAKKTTGIETTA